MSEDRRNSILIVEDNADMLQSLQERLKSEGLPVFTATTMEDGLKKLRENKIELLILDLLLGGQEGKSGADLVTEAQADNTIDFDAIKVIVLSDWPDVASALGEVLPVERYDYFHKPQTSLDEIAEAVIKKLNG